MNKIIGVATTAKDKMTKHRLEIEVEFTEPCTQYEAERIMQDIVADIAFRIAPKKGGEQCSSE